MKISFDIPKPKPTTDRFVADFTYATVYDGRVTAAFQYLQGAKTHVKSHCSTCIIRNLDTGEIVE